MAFSGDVTKLTHGPAHVELAGVSIGHTQGGIEATVSPENRDRTVDQYGSSPVAIIHTGDQVAITVPFSQWEHAKIQEVYNPGFDGTTYVGIGRSAGFLYTTKQMDIIPFLTAQVAQLLRFYSTTPRGEFTMSHTVDDDRIMEVEFAAIVRTGGTDGSLIGEVRSA